MSLADRSRELQSLLDAHWFRLLSAVAVLAFSLSILRTVAFAPQPINSDAAFYGHAGWYMTQGAVPYVDVWDVKPPLAFELPALLALLSFGDMGVLLGWQVLVTSLAGIGSVVLLGWVVHHLTGDGVAAFVAGALLLAYPGFHYLAAHGFRPKYFTMFFGLLALYLQRTHRPGWSGASAAAAAGFWQFGAVFPLTVLLLELAERRSVPNRGLAVVPLRALSGMAGLTALVVLPFAYWGALEPMLVEVVVAPFVLSESVSLTSRLFKGTLYLGGYLIPFVLLGVLGHLRAARDDVRAVWWVLVPTAWYGVQVFFLDLDGYPDLFLGLAFVAVGVGLYVARLDPGERTALLSAALVVLLLGTVFLGGFGVLGSRMTTTEEDVWYSDRSMLAGGLAVYAGWGHGNAETGTVEGVERYAAPDSRDLYWNKRRPCHYFMGDMGAAWVTLTDGRYVDMSCYDG